MSWLLAPWGDRAAGARIRWAAAFAALASLSRTAHAGSFTSTGAYVPDKAAVAVDDFEEYPPPPPPDPGAGGSGGAGGETGTGGGGGASGAGGAAPYDYGYTLEDDPTALTGSKVFKLAPWASAGVGVELPAHDGSYVARVWVKGEASVSVQVEYDDGEAFTLSQLFPTGKVTSDGWLELESAPFSVDQARGPKPGVGFFSPSGVTADALEIVPQGEVRKGASCTGIKDAACQSDELCLAHRCVDARGFVPPLPSPDERGAVVDYLENRMRFLFGPYQNRKLHLPASIAQLEEARTTQDRYRFWFSLIAAVERLSDSHSTTFALYQIVYGQNRVKGRTPLNACFVGGKADLTQKQAPSTPGLPDVLVSHTGQGATWGLERGDRLVAVDGDHPLVWAESLVGKAWTTDTVDDPASPAQKLEGLRGFIGGLAKTITVVRCHGTSTCGEPETLEVAAQTPPEEKIDFVACDNRPLHHVDGSPENHDVGQSVFAGLVKESAPGEQIYGVTWDSLYDVSGDLTNAVASWEKDGRGVILDHRTGNGGTADTALPILGFVTKPRYTHASLWRIGADEEAPATLADGLKLFEATKDDPGNFGDVGSDQARLDVPVALLVTRDVSASDYFPHSLKGSPNARIFGPHPTNGAYSSFSGLSYWLSISYQLAAGDTLGPDGAPLTGHGTVPDVIVEPAQSDLVVGKDSVYEAALAWVRANLKKNGGTP